MTPILSICVPSRNRQIYFQKTIEALLKSKLEGVEFVFADNSDDPSIMNDFMRDVVGDDPRVVYLPSTGSTLAMVDNWERTLEASTGDWISVIGDDDYLDPDLATVLRKALEVEPDLDAFSWRVLGYLWPFPGRNKIAVFVPFESFMVKVHQADLVRRMFGWFDSRHVPTSGFSIYHSAVSRRLMEKIKMKYGGRYFEHPVVDYDNAFKVICEGKNFASVVRPFSVMGSCPASNSFSIGKMETFRQRTLTFINEAGRNFEGDDNVKDLPFKSLLGTTATILQAQHWFKTKYNLNYKDWEPGFAKACEYDVQAYPDVETFELAREGYATAFKMWKKGKYLKYFKPKFLDRPKAGKYAVVSGFSEEGVYLDHDIGGAESPGEMFEIVRSMIVRAEDIEVDQTGLKYPWKYFEAKNLKVKKAA